MERACISPHNIEKSFCFGFYRRYFKGQNTMTGVSALLQLVFKLRLVQCLRSAHWYQLQSNQVHYQPYSSRNDCRTYRTKLPPFLPVSKATISYKSSWHIDSAIYFFGYNNDCFMNFTPCKKYLLPPVECCVLYDCIEGLKKHGYDIGREQGGGGRMREGVE